MVEVWFADTESGRPERTTCDEPGWPRCDAQGRTMFENTHYPTEREAWSRVRADAKAGFQLDAREVLRLRAELARIEKRALDSALRVVSIDEAFAEFERQTEAK